MKNIISKDIIICIALIYKYITEHQNLISRDDALRFLEEVNKNLRMMDACDYEVCLSEERFQELDNFIKKSSESYEIDFNYLQDYFGISINEWYDMIPREILHATLMENALSAIRIEKSYLQIKREYKKTYNTMVIWSLEETDAKENVKRVLEKEGNKNIKVGYASPTKIEGSPAYNVSYECDKLYESVDLLMMETKTRLRNNLFEKYFEVEDGVLLSDIVESTHFITQTWNELHTILEKSIKDYDSWSRLEDIKEIQYKNKKYLIIKVMIHKYIVIDLDTKKALSDVEAFNKLEEQLFIQNFNERPLGEKMYHRFYWFLTGNNEEEIINYYNENKKIFNYETKIFYKINSGDVYTFLSIRLNEGIQLSFQGKNQILYETLFINSDLTPCGIQDTKNRISIEKMREIFDRVPNIRIPKEYIPKGFYEDGLIKKDKQEIKIKKWR